MAARLRNVFEAVLPGNAAEAVTEIKAALLDRGALNAAMSGSGPTVFALFDGEAAASAARAALKGRYAQTFLARPVERLDKVEV